MNFILAEEANFDFRNIYFWYELKQRGLGNKFINVLPEGIGKINRKIIEYRRYFVSLPIRYVLLNKFPFSIFYMRVEEIATIVIAILHSKQNIQEILRSRL